MAPKSKERQDWTKWATVLIWLFTLISVMVLAKVHLTAPLEAHLHLREITFKTDSSNILGPSDQAEFIVSGVSEVSFEGSDIHLRIEDVPTQTNAGKVVFRGEASSSCTFQKVRVSPIQPADSSILSLMSRSWEGGSSFGIRTHGIVYGTLTSSSEENSVSEFSCDHIEIDGHLVENVSGEFIPHRNIWFSTNSDAQIDFRSHTTISFEETQIRVLSDMRISHVEPGQPPRETTVLLPPLAGQKNILIFSRANLQKDVNSSDLLLIRPTSDFYVKDIKVDEGIQVSLQGRVKDTLEGAGSKDLVSVMPSAFEEMDAKKRIFAVIPAIVSTILSTLGLKKKNSE